VYNGPLQTRRKAGGGGGGHVKFSKIHSTNFRIVGVTYIP